MVQKYRVVAACLATMVVAAGAMPAQAATTLLNVKNAGFELGTFLADGGYGASHEGRGPTDWRASGGSGTGRWNPNTTHFADEAAHQGVGWTSGPLGTVSNTGMLAQIISDYTIEANTLYTLTLDVGRRFENTASSWMYDFALISDFGLSGASILTRATSNVGANGQVMAVGGFQTLTLQFQTGATGPEIGRQLAIALADASPLNGYGVAYDNIRLEASSLAAPAPEPGTWALMITGFGAVGAAIRRRRSAAWRPA